MLDINLDILVILLKEFEKLKFTLQTPKILLKPHFSLGLTRPKSLCGLAKICPGRTRQPKLTTQFATMLQGYFLFL